MSLFEIENTEVGHSLSLYDLKIKPTFGMQGAGEPTERGTLRMLEELRKRKDNNGGHQYFLQSELITGYPIPSVRVDAWFVSSWSPNTESCLSCLNLIWLVNDIEQVFSPDIKQLLKNLKWTEYAGPFDF